MKFFPSAIALAFAATAIASPHARLHQEVEKRQTPVRACSHLTGGVHIIAASGKGSADPPYGLLDTLRQSLMNSIPGSSNVSLPYDKTLTNGLQQSYEGTNTLNQYISQYHQACPHTKMVLIGYSVGGIMVLNSLCGEGPQYSTYGTPVQHLDGATYGPVVVAAVTYGEETRATGQSYYKGTCTVGGPHPRPQPGAACGYGWAARIQDYCDSDDNQCCNSGTTNASHYLYAQRYDTQATQFVLNQLKNPKYGGT